MPVIKLNLKTFQVLGALGTDALNELFGRDAVGLGFEHDGRAVCVVSPHKVYGMTRHAHGPYPDVGLDVLHDVANMKRAIGVRQGGRNEQGAGHGGC